MIRYDYETRYAFVGDYSGQITLLKLEQNTCSIITTLKGHEGKVTLLIPLDPGCNTSMYIRMGHPHLKARY